MSKLFSIESKSKPNPVPTSQSKYTALMIPRQVHAYLSLFALCRKTSKSKIIRDRMEQWYKETKKNTYEETLLKEVTNVIQIEWDHRKRVNEKIWKGNVSEAFENFKKEMKTLLTQKSISKTHTAIILRNVKE